MPRFRFTAVDSYGTPHDGTIDAATETDARNKLASNGLAVRSVEETAAAAGVPAPELPRRPAPKPVGVPGPPPARVAAFEPSERPEPRRGSSLPLVFSLLALFVSVGTAVYTLTRDPNRSRLSKYDFSTPEAAYKSSIRMAADGDVLARFEWNAKRVASLGREQLRTADVDHTVDHKGKKLLFVKYELKGKSHYRVRWFEKDKDNGMWHRSFEMEYGEEARNLPEWLMRDVQQWVSKSEGDHDPMTELDW